MGLINKNLAKAYFKYQLFRNLSLLRCIRELETIQWLSKDKIEKIQFHKLEAILKQAYQNVLYYRKKFDELGINPKDIKSFYDYLRIPVLTKTDIQENNSAFLARNRNKENLIRNHTGGSTGEPLTFYQDENYLNYSYAGIQLSFGICGYKAGDKQLFLWGSDADAMVHNGIKGKIIDYLENSKFINTFNLTEKSLLTYLEKLYRWSPKFIWGYASSLEMLARFMIKERKPFALKPAAIQSTAEVLTPMQRKVIESVFSCKVFDRYGCREVGIVAHECSAHQGLHIYSPNNYVEVLDNSNNPVKDGEIGKIVVTNLNNYAMPFIRYEIGDLGMLVKDKCKCGRNWPRLKKIVGRVSDTIISPSGKMIHGEFFTHLFYGFSNVKQFQVVQETQRDLTIKIVKRAKFSEEQLKFLIQKIHKFGDENFRIKFEFCNQIPAASSGKFRYTISHVNKDE